MIYEIQIFSPRPAAGPELLARAMACFMISLSIPLRGVVRAAIPLLSSPPATENGEGDRDGTRGRPRNDRT